MSTRARFVSACRDLHSSATTSPVKSSSVARRTDRPKSKAPFGAFALQQSNAEVVDAVARASLYVIYGIYKQLSDMNETSPFLSPAAVNGAEKPLTTAQLAEHLQITPRTLATWRALGRIPFWRCNRRCLRYRLSDVERALSKS